MSYQAGELRSLVTFQRLQNIPDGSGGFTDDSWEDLRKEYAHVRPLSGSERQAADRTEAISGYLVVIRARPRQDYTEKDRAIWEGRALNIRFVRERKPRSLYLEIECSLGVAI